MTSALARATCAALLASAFAGSCSSSESGPPTIRCSDPLPALDSVRLVDTPLPGLLGIVPVPGSSDLALVQQSGVITLARDGALVPGPFLDLSSRPMVDDGTGGGGEQGLLGLAFDPDYASSGRFFVAYTLGDDSGTPANERRNVVAEYARSGPGSDVASEAEVTRLVDIEDPEWNHNGSHLVFGPDGYLYASIGDGGGGGDGHGVCGNGLSTSTLLGKILRLDIDAPGSDYAAPNPPFSGAAGLPQIAHYGLRNPWRFSFDRLTGDLYVGDVGQDAREEIDFLPASSPLGVNFGWARYEGTLETSYASDPACDALVANATAPVADFSHTGLGPLGSPRAIVGGFVYRGSAIAGLAGTYLLADAVSNQVAALRRCSDGTTAIENVESLTNVEAGGAVTFGEDHDGELYIGFLGSGYVRKIVSAAP